MAKELSPTDLVAALVALGMDVPEALTAKVENEVEDKAFTKISKSLVTFDSSDKEDVERAEMWQADLFAMADNFGKDFRTERKNRGQGERMITFLSIETHAGTFKIELSSAV